MLVQLFWQLKLDRANRRQARRQQLEQTRQLLRQRNFDGYMYLYVSAELIDISVTISLVLSV